MEKLPNNSDAYREKNSIKPPEMTVQPVVKGPVKVRKRNSLRELTDGFIQEDISTVRNSVWNDVLIPAAKKTIYDMITGGLEMFFYGAAGMPKRRSNMESVSYKNNNSRPAGKGVGLIKDGLGYRFANVVFEDRGDAERVKVTLLEIIDHYPAVRVADLYSAAGMTGNYTDNNYGWKDLSGIKVIMVEDGYVINLPKPVPLDNDK